MNKAAPDNWGWHAALGLFAVCQGLKFLLVPTLFWHYRSYVYLARQPIHQEGWAAILFAYGAAALACVFVRHPAARGTVSVLSVPLWLYLGSEMMLGSIFNNVWTSDGVFELLAAAGSLVLLLARLG